MLFVFDWILDSRPSHAWSQTLATVSLVLLDVVLTTVVGVIKYYGGIKAVLKK